MKKAAISKQESFSTTLSRSYIVFTLRTKEEQFEVASIMVYVKSSGILSNVLHSIISYGSSSDEKDDFVIKWNHSIETILHRDGRIDIKYLSMPNR